LIRPPARAAAVLAACSLVASAGRADWLVFVGGSVAETSGPWELRGRQVRFRPPSEQLQSISIDEVDLASSAFLSAQLGATRPTAPAAEAPPASAPASPAAPAAPPCRSGRALRPEGTERIVVDTGGGLETVRLACFDGPEANAGLEPIVHYVAAFEREASRLLAVRPAVCFEPDAELASDETGSRVAYLRLADGRDLGGELIRRGFAVAAPGRCTRAAEYRRLEREAAARGSGLWAAATGKVARAIVAGLPRFSKAKRRPR
jgi:endonuclease YncB( thermonuclease family)